MQPLRLYIFIVVVCSCLRSADLSSQHRLLYIVWFYTVWNQICDTFNIEILNTIPPRGRNWPSREICCRPKMRRCRIFSCFHVCSFLNLDWRGIFLRGMLAVWFRGLDLFRSSVGTKKVLLYPGPVIIYLVIISKRELKSENVLEKVSKKMWKRFLWGTCST